jgi:serine/threonine protein kinase
MATYTRLGAYLLSGELTADPLGKVNRGVGIVGNSFDRHLLVRSFSDEMLHAGLAAKLGDSAKILPLLGGSKSFGVGYRVEAGAVPHIACDYVPGRSLAQMIEKARHEQIPFGVDHALSVIQGLAQGIILLHGKGLAHGTLSPHSVWISFEGAAQILDVPFAGIVKTLLSKAPFLKASLEPYIREGVPNTLHQDLYALGAILYELLTFEKLPIGANVNAALAAMTLKAAQEDAPITGEIQGLLRRLLLVGQPYEDVNAFNAELERVLYDGDYSPTTFNMAFFMHTLFREENDRDGQAMKADQLEDFTPYTSAVEAAKQRPMGMEPMAHEGELVTQKSTLVKVGIGVAAALLVIVGGGGYYIHSQKKEMNTIQSQLVDFQREQAVAQQKAADLGSQEGVAQKEKEIVAKKLSEAKTSTEKEQLQKQLDEAKAKQEEISKARQEEERKVADSKAKAQQLLAAVGKPPAPAPVPAPQTPPAQQPQIQPSVAPASQSAPAASQPAVASAPKASEPARPMASVPTPAAAAGPAPTPTPVSAPAAAQPSIETPPQMQNRSMPSIPSRAKNPMNPNRLKDVSVAVRVFVNAGGIPSKTTIVEGIEGPWGYNESAVDAALACTYLPATKDGKPINGNIVVNFKFPRMR